ncbi:MAG: ABC transporter permease [Bryobacteraceae bacterium]|nr:ABC transporter permease [Bryobacteraceae bacterium]
MFELFVAGRYLRAKRKQAVISVITVISVLGVAAGVMALIIALAVNNGFRGTFQRSLLGATAHINVLEKQVDQGIPEWRSLTAKIAQIPRVTGAAATLYGSVFLSGPLQPAGCVLKGIDPQSPTQRADVLKVLRSGSLDALEGDLPGIILGSKLAQETGMRLNSHIQVISPQGEMTPFGFRPAYFRMKVVGIFESGFYDLDKTWAFTSLKQAQRVMSLPDVVNSIEIKVSDLDAAPEIAREVERLAGPKLAALPWTEQNRQILGAMRLERTVAILTIGLIQMVAALNILISLIMMVMEKQRDIAILMSMGTRRDQVRRIFLYQGLLIGVIGASLGLILGYGLCYLGDRYRWISLDEAVYSIAYVPFETRWVDGLWVAGLAIAVSVLATLYPARAATRVAPAEALRYE